MSWNRKNQRSGKYNNHKTTVDGRKFDSKREAERYLFLKRQEQEGVIKELCCQDRFEITDAYTDSTGKKHRARYYIADFTYIKGEEFVVEDVKSKATITDVYKIKKDLMQNKYGIEIKEILK